MEFILASSSPRRKELFARLVPDFTIEPSLLPEVLPDGIAPKEAVESLALQKAEDVFDRHNRSVVIGADTVVALEGKIFGKPKDEADAVQMLQALSGKVHTVYTGVAVLAPQVREIFSVATGVEFYPLSQEEIVWYLSTGEPADKAGAYGIQELGALLVRGIYGDFFNVIGLPIAQLWRVFTHNGILCKNKF